MEIARRIAPVVVALAMTTSWAGSELASFPACGMLPGTAAEGVLGRPLASPPSPYAYAAADDSAGCLYDAGPDGAGERRFAYVVALRAAAWAELPRRRDVAVDGIGEEAYFDDGPEARELRVRIDDRAALVVGVGARSDEAACLEIAGRVLAAPRFSELLYVSTVVRHYFPDRSCADAEPVRYDAWRAADATGRAAMVFDVLCANDVAGRTRAEVEERLGPPDVMWRQFVIYRLRPEPPWEASIPPPPPPPPFSLVPGRYELWIGFGGAGLADAVAVQESVEPEPPDAVVRPEAARETP